MAPALLLFGPIAARRLAVFGHDVTLLWVFCTGYTGEALSGGRLPLWDPHIFGGMPWLAAYQTCVCYPPTWISAVVPAPLAVTLLTGGHVAGGSLAAWWCARRLGADRWGAVIAAWVHMLSGFAVSHVFGGHLPIIQGWAWVPAFLAAAYGCAGGLSPGRVALAAGCFAGLVLAGSIQIVWFGLLAAGVLAIAWGCGRPAAAWRGPVVAGVLAMVAGLALSAPQVLPTASLAAEASRGRRMPSDWYAEHRWHPGNLALLLAPDARGRMYLPFDPDTPERPPESPPPPAAPRAPEFPNALPTTGFWWEQAMHVGIVALFLAGAAFASAVRSLRGLAMLGGVALLGAWVVAPLITHGGAIGYWLAAPFTAVGRLRVPARLVGLTTLAVALLAARGLPALVATGIADRQRAVRFGATGAALAAAAGLAAGLVASSAAPLQWGAIALGVLPGAVAVAGLAWLATRPVVRTAWVAALAVGGVAVELGIPARRVVSGFPNLYARTIFPDRDVAPAVLRRLAEPARTVRYWPGVAIENSGLATRLEMLEGFEPLILGRTLRVLDRVIGDGDSPGRMIVSSDQLLRRMGDPTAARWLDLLNLRWIWAQAAPGWDALPPGVHAVEGAYERTTALPRAFVVGAARAVADADAAVAAVEAPAFQPAGEAVVEGSPDGLPTGAVGSAGTARVLGGTGPERITVDVEATRDGLLVLSVPWSRGWRVSVDGDAPRAPLVADALLQAVPVRAGTHRVEFTYHAPGFGAGCAAAAAAVLALLAWGGLARRRRVA